MFKLKGVKYNKNHIKNEFQEELEKNLLLDFHFFFVP